MDLKLKTIATYATPEEAEVACAALKNEGITACFENSSLVGMAWYLSNAVGGVKLLVSEADEPRARDVLAKATCAAPSEFVIGRCCASCGVDAPRGFDICWSCGAALDEKSDVVERPPAKNHSAATASHEEPAEEASGDEAARRAFRAAVIGIGLCPPLLNVYSMHVGSPSAHDARAQTESKREQVFSLGNAD